MGRRSHPAPLLKASICVPSSDGVSCCVSFSVDYKYLLHTLACSGFSLGTQAHRCLGGKGQGPDWRLLAPVLWSDRSWAEQRLRRSEVTTRTQCHQGQRQTPSWRLRCPHGSLARLTDCSQPLHFGGYLGSRLRLRCPDSTVLPPDSSQTALTTTAQIHLFYFFLKKKKKGKDPTKQQKQGSCPAPMGAGHASGWAGRSTPRGGCGLSNTSLGVGGANRGEVQRRRVSQQSQRKVHGRPRPPPPAGAEGLSAGLRSQREVVSTAHSAGWGGRTPVPAVRQPKPSRNPWRPRAWRCGGVATALLGPLSAGRLRRTWAWTPSCGAWRRGSWRQGAERDTRGQFWAGEHTLHPGRRAPPQGPLRGPGPLRLSHLGAALHESRTAQGMTRSPRGAGARQGSRRWGCPELWGLIPTSRTGAAGGRKGKQGGG